MSVAEAVPVPDLSTSIPPADPWLSRFAKVLVFLTFALLLLGGLVTTFGAGMAVPTWPTIHGEMNPPGWWENRMVLLEHSHRLTAIAVGICTGILCAWIWRNGWALVVAFIVSGLADAIGHPLHLSGNVIAQLRIWPAAVVFLGMLFWFQKNRRQSLAAEHWLVLAAYIAVCIQATLGGLRVTRETAGALDAAMFLRVVHGCFAQVFLALIVVLAARLSPVWRELATQPTLEYAGRIRRMAIAAAGIYFAQLIVAAAMRHPGAGLAIPLWPQAQANGSWLPADWNTFTVLNFLHTRVIAVLLVGHVVSLGVRIMRSARHNPRIARPGYLLLALVLVQFALGVLVIWKTRHPHITTTHVFNGTAILAACMLLATRARQLASSSRAVDSLPNVSPARA